MSNDLKVNPVSPINSSKNSTDRDKGKKPGQSFKDILAKMVDNNEYTKDKKDNFEKKER